MNNYENMIAQEAVTLCATLPMSRYYTPTEKDFVSALRERILVILDRERLPAGVPDMISSIVEKQIMPLVSAQEEEDYFIKQAARVLGRPATCKKDRTLARRRLTVERKKREAAEELRKRIEDALSPVYDAVGFRQAEGAWAGGEHVLTVKVGDAVSCSGDSDRVWSDNGKWSGLNSYHDITVKPTWIEDVLDKCLIFEDALVLDAEEVEPHLWRAKVARQGRGFELRGGTRWLAWGEDGLRHFPTEKGARRYHVAPSCGGCGEPATLRGGSHACDECAIAAGY